MKPAHTLAAAVLALATAAALPLPARANTAASASAEPAFDIHEYEVEGNTRLPQVELERVLEPHLGSGLTLRHVEAARQALERAYQQAGWLSVLVDIPEQRVADGVVRLRVSEGKVAATHITGAQWYDQERILERLPAVQSGQVPDFLALQSQLDELNRLPTRQVRPVLRPGVEPGTLDIEFKVQDRSPLSGQVELHNRHALHTTPWRLSASLRHDNLWQREHALSLDLMVAPERPTESRSLTLGYGWPLQAGRQLQFSLTEGRSLTLPAGATVAGGSSLFGVVWSMRTPDDGGSQALSIGVEWRDLQQDVGTGGSVAVSSPLRYAPLTLGWSRTGGSGSGRRWTSQDVSAQLTLGLRPWSGRQVLCVHDKEDPVFDDQFNCSRQGADGGFGVLRLGLRHDGPFGAEGSSRLALRTTAQIAGQPLVSSEQLNAGGALSVRGYRDATASGDLGLLVSAEWRSPDLLPALSPTASGARPAGTLHGLLFADAAQLHVLDPQDGQSARRRLAGIGGGLRWRATGGLNADLDLAWPLSRDAALGRGALPRVHARMALPF
ncbi:MAG: hypothetical protein RLY78_191 [Pseudomonadota bacterium]|jgi:hemolysin activation/secretion protein